MLALDLSAIYFKSSRFQDSFLVAHFEQPELFKSGEYTSDLLGYFGFGMGVYRRDPKSPPDFVYGFQFSQYPCLVESLTTLEDGMDTVPAKTVLFSDVIQWMQGLTGWYAYHGIYFSPNDLRIFVDVLASYLDMPISPDVRRELTGPEPPAGVSVSECAVMFEVTEDGEVVIGLGGPPVETKLDSTYSFFDLKRDNHRFDWQHSAQLGTPTNILRILDSMKIHNFSADDRLTQATKVEHIIHHLGKIKDAT